MYMRVKIETVNEAVLVPVIRRVASRVLRELGADENTQDRVMTIVTEACSNVVKYAFVGSGMYEVGLEYSIGKAKVCVLDDGNGFDADSISKPDIMQIGGRGLQLMRDASTAFSIESIPGKGTRITAEIPVEYHSERYRRMIAEMPSLKE